MVFHPEDEPVNPLCEESVASGFVEEKRWVIAFVSLKFADAPVHIAMVSAQASPLASTAGEQSVHVAELSAALARQGHRVTVYTRRDAPGLLECIERSEGYTDIHVPAGPPELLASDEMLRAMGPFAQYLATAWGTDRPDLTHAHSWISGIPTELVARELGLPTVLRFHGLGAKGLRLRMESKLAKNATRVSASCTDEAFELIRLGKARQCTAVIPTGVDTKTFTPEGPRAPRGAMPRLLSVGKVLPCNGFGTVIQALPFIPEAEFVVAGDVDIAASDAEARRLHGLAEELGVADRVRLHGHVTAAEMPALLRSADVLVCTPEYESSGAVALAAMACGKPVVACAVGALIDIVVDDVTGSLTVGQDPRGLANTITSLLQDSFLRRSLGSAGRDRTVARYGWDRIAADMLRLYEAAIAAGECAPQTAAR